MALIKEFLDYFRKQSYPNLFSNECITHLAVIESAYGSLDAVANGFEIVISEPQRTADTGFLIQGTESGTPNIWYELDYASFKENKTAPCVFTDALSLKNSTDLSHFYDAAFPALAGKERSSLLLPMLQHCLELLGNISGASIQYIGAMNSRGENSSLRIVTSYLEWQTIVPYLKELKWSGNQEKLNAVLESLADDNHNSTFSLNFDIFTDHVSEKISLCFGSPVYSKPAVCRIIDGLVKRGWCVPEKQQDLRRWEEARPEHTPFISNDIAFFKFSFEQGRVTKTKAYLRQSNKFSEQFFPVFIGPRVVTMDLSSSTIQGLKCFPDKNREIYWIQEAASAGIRTVQLCGENLFDCPYLEDLISLCRSYSLDITLRVPSDTDSDDIQAHLKESVKAGITGISVVFDDSLQNAKAAFARTLTLIHESGVCSTNVCWILRKSNTDDLPDLLQLAAQFNIRSVTACAFNPDKKPAAPEISEKQMHTVADGISAYRGPVQIIIDPCFSPLRAVVGQQAFINLNTGVLKGCRAGHDSIAINSSGRLTPCRFLDCPENFLSIVDYWNNSAILKQMRDSATSSKSTCSSCLYSSNCIPCFALQGTKICPLAKQT